MSAGRISFISLITVSLTLVHSSMFTHIRITNDNTINTMKGNRFVIAHWHSTGRYSIEHLVHVHVHHSRNHTCPEELIQLSELRSINGFLVQFGHFCYFTNFSRLF